jgi:hypothetical protein
MKSFGLPDGTEVVLPNSIFCGCSEILFEGEESLTNLVTKSIMLCDDGIKSDMANNIIIAGGTAMLASKSASL